MVDHDIRLAQRIRTRIVEPLANNAQILRSWNVWADALGYFGLVAITYTIMTWIPTYLVQVKQFSIIKVGLVAAAPWVGAVLGNVIGGTLSDKVFRSRRKPVMMITAVSTIFLMYSLKYAPNDMTILGIMLLLAGIFLNLGYSMFLAYPRKRCACENEAEQHPYQCGTRRRRR